MNDIPTVENFEPSHQTKLVWRYTRKSPKNFSGVELPGLFRTTGFTMDAVAVVAVLFLEAWGLYNFYLAGGEILYVACFFLADVAFAIGRHLGTGPICEYNNRLVVASSPEEEARLRSKKARWQMISPLFSIGILGVAAFKVLAFIVLQNGEFNGLTTAILLSYALAALIHITKTGYFVSAIFTSILTSRDHSKYINSTERQNSFRAGLRRYTLKNDGIKLNQVQVDNRHRIYKADNQEVHIYRLETKGVLLDRQLDALVNAQETDNAKMIVARESLKAQLDILHAEPGGVVEETVVSPPSPPPPPPEKVETIDEIAAKRAGMTTS